MADMAPASMITHSYMGASPAAAASNILILCLLTGFFGTTAWLRLTRPARQNRPATRVGNAFD
jgi:hypothetical protein